MDIPGYKIDAVLGEVMGMTVRSANIGANFIAGFKSLGGGEISEYTNLVYDSRNQVMQRMWEQCVQRGGNAIIGMRFDTGDIGQSFSEVCAYGTAVVMHPIGTEEEGGTPQSIAQANAPAGGQAGQPEYPGAPSQPQPQPPPGFPGAPSGPMGQPGMPPQGPPMGQPGMPPMGQPGMQPMGQPGMPPMGQPGMPPMGQPGMPPQGYGQPPFG